MPHKTKPLSWIAASSGYRKIVLSIMVAAFGFCIACLFNLSTTTRFIIGWDTFALSMIMLDFFLFFKTSSGQLYEIVTHQDDNISVIFTIVLSTVCVSLLAAILLLLNAQESAFDKEVRATATILAIATSWVLLHTIFTIRYAHLYHSYHGIEKKGDNGGLDFPGDEKPDYIDFAYFSFVIGMTFQVSDVTISSKTIRRYALLHSLISFVFNTIIVALTVNIIAGIIK